MGTENGVMAEKALLGTFFIKPELFEEVAEGLRPEDFLWERNRILFKTFISFYDRGEIPDHTMICEELKRTGEYEKVGGKQYIADLIADAPFTDHLKSYQKAIKDAATIRRINKATDEIKFITSGNYEDITSVTAKVEDLILDATKPDTLDTEATTLKSVLLDAMKRIHERVENGGEASGIPTGFKDLDEMTAGLHPANLIILAARPSMGKTAFALNILEQVTLHQNRHALFFSLEMSKEELAERLLTSASFTDSSKVRTGNLDNEEWNALMQASEIMINGALDIIDTPALTLSEIRTIARRQNKIKKLDLIVIDYLQLILSERRTENKQVEVAEISRGLKQLARELDCPVLCLSQLSRSPEYRTDKRPVLSDLRDSGSIEQDADLVMFLYRDGYYNHEEAEDNQAELNIAKQRSGPTGTVYLKWISEWTRFTDIDWGENGTFET